MIYEEVVFVFGSNRAGRHGLGAALEARNRWGAKTGKGCGRTGDAYAIPTKDEDLEILSLGEQDDGVLRFFEYAKKHPKTLFILTPVGCGLAARNGRAFAARLKKEMRPPENVVLHQTWLDHLA